MMDGAGVIITLTAGAFAYLYKRSQIILDRELTSHAKSLGMLRNEIADQDKRHTDALASYKLHVAETYVTTSELTTAIDRLTETVQSLFEKLNRIEDKLDRKADKP